MYKIFLYHFFFNLEESGPELSHTHEILPDTIISGMKTTVCKNGEWVGVSKRLWNEVS